MPIKTSNNDLVYLDQKHKGRRKESTERIYLQKLKITTFQVWERIRYIIHQHRSKWKYRLDHHHTSIHTLWRRLPLDRCIVVSPLQLFHQTRQNWVYHHWRIWCCKNWPPSYCIYKKSLCWHRQMLEPHNQHIRLVYHSIGERQKCSQCTYTWLTFYHLSIYQAHKQLCILHLRSQRSQRQQEVVDLYILNMLLPSLWWSSRLSWFVLS